MLMSVRGQSETGEDDLSDPLGFIRPVAVSLQRLQDGNGVIRANNGE